MEELSRRDSVRLSSLKDWTSRCNEMKSLCLCLCLCLYSPRLNLSYLHTVFPREFWSVIWAARWYKHTHSHKFVPTNSEHCSCMTRHGFSETRCLNLIHLRQIIQYLYKYYIYLLQSINQSVPITCWAQFVLISLSNQLIPRSDLFFCSNCLINR